MTDQLTNRPIGHAHFNLAAVYSSAWVQPSHSPESNFVTELFRLFNNIITQIQKEEKSQFKSVE